MMMLALLAAVAVEAAVSQVTVFSDRARVTRAAQVQVDGSARVELPLLPDTVDPGSIRLAAAGALVQKLDIQHVEPDDFPVTEARELLAKLEKIDDQLSLLGDQQGELQQHLAALRKIEPRVKDEPLRPRQRLDPKGWGAALSFAQSEEDALRARMRDNVLRTGELQRERQPLAERARLIGGAARRSGYRVTATLQGQGGARLELTYLAARARWTPAYDLQLLPDQRTVRVSFSGAASQETGEDWDSAALTLSTAIPATVRALPEIATWKIGEKERFIPTPWRADRPRPPPPPPWRPLPAPEDATGALRQQLLSRAAGQPQPQASPELEPQEAPMPAAAPPPGMMMKTAPAPSRRREAPAGAPAMAPVAAEAALAPPPVEGVGIAPPPSWRPPPVPPDSPAAMAGGYDLEFSSLRRETVRTGGGARRVLLFSETWPVTTERLIYPALAPDAYLVAQIRNPSQRTLPRGQAALSVGADPSGTAALPLVAPGEELTLPLGVDKGVRFFRNVAQVQSEKGLFSKDDVTRYEVTIEVQNPYAAPVPLRIVDQLPLAGDKNMEVQVVDLEGARREEGTGKLTWRLTAPASGKVKVGFVYQLKRPQGFRVHQ